MGAIKVYFVGFFQPYRLCSALIYIALGHALANQFLTREVVQPVNVNMKTCHQVKSLFIKIETYKRLYFYLVCRFQIINLLNRIYRLFCLKRHYNYVSPAITCQIFTVLVSFFTSRSSKRPAPRYSPLCEFPRSTPFKISKVDENSGECNLTEKIMSIQH